MAGPTSDVAFTPSVKALQTRAGSRAAYARLEEQGGFEGRVTPKLAVFLAERDSFYLATASATGRPYIQHRGGPPGFLRVLDEHTLAFADFSGNRQYITAGNLAENDQAYIFLTDYATRRRIKIWGRARVVDDDPALLERIADPSYDASPERAIVFTVEAWDTNCRQHIPQLVSAAAVKVEIDALRARIDALERENRALREQAVARAALETSSSPNRLVIDPA